MQIEGAHLWSWNKKALLPAYQGIGVDDEICAGGSAGADLLISRRKATSSAKVDPQLTKTRRAIPSIYRID